jgi:uroporphyrinogen-III decarboxylase
MDLGRDCPGYFFAVGNHIPPNVPLENAMACMEAYWEMRKR